MLVPVQQGHASVLLGQSLSSVDIGSLQGDTISQQWYFLSPASVDISFGVGFNIVADILDADIATVTNGVGGPQEINAKLLLNGTEVQMSSFQWQQPTGKIGGVLNADVDIASLSLVPTDATVDLQLLVKVAGVWKTYKVLTGGKLVGRDHSKKFLGGDHLGPHDEITISAFEKINDILDYSPRFSLIVYDPSKREVVLPKNPNDGNYILTEGGSPIIPRLVPMYGLNLYTILQLAYESGLGLAVTTNISNYSVARVDISVEGTWHGAVAGLYSMFDPVIFSNDTLLYIIDVDQVVPGGTNAVIISKDSHFALGNVKPFKSNKNAVLVTYEYKQRDSTNSSNLVEEEIVETDSEENGDPFEEGYTRTETTVTTIEVTSSDDPDTILDDYELFRSVVTVANIVDPQTSALTQKQVAQEDTCIFYDDEATVIGYGKTVWGLWTSGGAREPVSLNIKTAIPTRDPGSFARPSVSYVPSPTLIVVSTEENSVSWIDDPFHAGGLIQDSNITLNEGLIYQSSEAERVINPVTGQEQDIFRKWPLLVAQSSGIIDEAGTILWGPITTSIETLIRIKKNQSKMSVCIIDHLNGNVKTSYTSGKVQSRDAGSNDDGNKMISKTMLLRDRASEVDIGPRAPESLTTQGLAQSEAITLGYRVLARYKTPPVQQPVELTGVEFSARRGSVFRIEDRDGTLRSAFVTGLSISGSNLGQEGHHIGMILDTITHLVR